MLNHNIWQGEKVRLRAVEPQDWVLFTQFDLDSEVARDCYWIPFPKSQEATRKWTLEQSLARSERDSFCLVIENLQGEAVGTINTHSCELKNGTFSYGLAISREHWHNGYASEAILLVLRYFFLELRYQKVNVGIYAYNDASVKLHEKFGFIHEGRQRRMYYSNGKYHDSYMMGMTIEEFLERYGTLSNHS